jgi:hypothetical protein
LALFGIILRSIRRWRCLGNRAAILRSKNFFETGATAVPAAVHSVGRRLRVGVFRRAQ